MINYYNYIDKDGFEPLFRLENIYTSYAILEHRKKRTTLISKPHDTHIELTNILPQVQDEFTRLSYGWRQTEFVRSNFRFEIKLLLRGLNAFSNIKEFINYMDNKVSIFYNNFLDKITDDVFTKNNFDINELDSVTVDSLNLPIDSTKYEYKYDDNLRNKPFYTMKFELELDDNDDDDNNDDNNDNGLSALTRDLYIYNNNTVRVKLHFKVKLFISVLVYPFDKKIVCILSSVRSNNLSDSYNVWDTFKYDYNDEMTADEFDNIIFNILSDVYKFYEKHSKIKLKKKTSTADLLRANNFMESCFNEVYIGNLCQYKIIRFKFKDENVDDFVLYTSEDGMYPVKNITDFEYLIFSDIDAFSNMEYSILSDNIHSKIVFTRNKLLFDINSCIKSYFNMKYNIYKISHIITSYYKEYMKEMEIEKHCYMKFNKIFISDVLFANNFTDLVININVSYDNDQFEFKLFKICVPINNPYKQEKVIKNCNAGLINELIKMHTFKDHNEYYNSSYNSSYICEGRLKNFLSKVKNSCLHDKEFCSEIKSIYDDVNVILNDTKNECKNMIDYFYKITDLLKSWNNHFRIKSDIKELKELRDYILEQSNYIDITKLDTHSFVTQLNYYLECHYNSNFVFHKQLNKEGE